MTSVKLHIELGHTYREWLELTENEEGLWDILLSDVVDEAITPDEDTTYWLVYDNDNEIRLCEVYD